MKIFEKAYKSILLEEGENTEYLNNIRALAENGFQPEEDETGAGTYYTKEFGKFLVSVHVEGKGYSEDPSEQTTDTTLKVQVSYPDGIEGGIIFDSEIAGIEITSPEHAIDVCKDFLKRLQKEAEDSIAKIAFEV